LSESGLEHHPINPMTDPDIRRWLARQTRGAVGHVALPTLRKGAAACRDGLLAEGAAGRQLVVVDAIDDGDLSVIADAADGFPLLVGGSGVALGLPALYRRHGLIGESSGAWQGAGGKAVALSGSCSKATRGQVAHHRQSHPQRKIDTDALMAGTLQASALADWAMAQEGLPLIYSSDDPAAVEAAQKKHGAHEVASRLEAFFGDIAKALVSRGAERLIIAGGETSGAVVTALSLEALEIGPKIDPGVPAVRSGALVLALKSGNFGAEDFFEKAMTVMGQ
ncbi:MAG: nucleotide-binding domain containing protein, partial [Pseudomonadota bacterium]